MKNKKALFALILAIIAMLSFYACSEKNEAVSISAVYEGTNPVFADTALDDLKSGLEVTATMQDQTTVTLDDDDYELSGTLVSNQECTITVTHGDLSTTFTVTVSRKIVSISATYEQGDNVIYADTALNTLKEDLEVKVVYDNQTEATIESNTYQLSGTLVSGQESTITVTYGQLSATFSVTVSRKIVSVSATYDQGSNVIYADTALDALKNDLVVIIHYDNQTEATLEDNDYQLSGILTPGEESTITVTYGTFTDTFEVTVSTKIVSISATYNQGNKVIYTSGSLDDLKADLIVKAIYDDGSEPGISQYQLSGNLTEGESTITVTYGSYTTTFKVTVTAVTLTEIRVAYTQSGNVYIDSDVDEIKEAVTVTAYYNNGTTADVTGSSTITGSLAEVGENTFIVEYGGKQATFIVNVSEVSFRSNKPLAAQYAVGSQLSIPSGKFFSAIQTQASFKVIAPDKTELTDTEITLSQSGQYSIVYSATVGEKVLSHTLTFGAYVKPEFATGSSEESYVYSNTNVPGWSGGGVDLLGVKLKAGDTLTFNMIYDFDFAAGDFLQLSLCELTKAEYAGTNICFTFTDVADASKVLKVYYCVYPNEDSAIYIYCTYGDFDSGNYWGNKFAGREWADNAYDSVFALVKFTRSSGLVNMLNSDVTVPGFADFTDAVVTVTTNKDTNFAMIYYNDQRKWQDSTLWASRTPSLVAEGIMDVNYAEGAEIIVPDYNLYFGNSVKTADVSITLPDGTVSTKKTFTATQTGTYKVTYSTQFGGQTYSQTLTFTVGVKPEFAYPDSEGSFIYSTYHSLWGSGTEMLGVNLEAGKTITFTERYDFNGGVLHEGTLYNDLTLDFGILSADDYKGLKLTLTFVDVNNPSKVLKIYWAAYGNDPVMELWAEIDGVTTGHKYGKYMGSEFAGSTLASIRFDAQNGTLTLIDTIMELEGLEEFGVCRLSITSNKDVRFMVIDYMNGRRWQASNDMYQPLTSYESHIS